MAAMKPTDLLARRWWLTAALAVLGGLAGLAYGALAPPTYTTSAYVLVVAQNPAESVAAVSYAQTYARLAQDGAVVISAASASQGTVSVSDLQRSVRVSASPDAPIIEVSGSAGTPRRAADYANLVADGLVRTGTAQASNTRMNTILVSAARPPAGPSSPQLALSVAVGTAVGFLLGGLLFMIRRPGGGTPGTGQPGPDRVRARALGETAGWSRTSPVLTDLP